MKIRFGLGAIAWAGLSGLSGAALAQTLPTGGSVAAGSASISSPRAGTLNINQSSNQAIVNWQSFSVGTGGTVNFNQPGASSATLNRVTGSTPSSIAGTINAPGTVILVNPNGIAITKSGVINTGSFAASTLDIKNEDFLAGKYKFSGNGSSATVTNAGRINVSDGGFAALLGGRVANDGVITARLGKVGLASGEMITLDMSGDGFVSVAVPSNQLGNLRDGTGKALVTNKGRIVADGGTVFLSAATASTLLRDAVNVPGSIRANSVGTSNGRIVIGGGTGGRVNVSGRLAARGKGPNTTGGRIDISGAEIALTSAKIDASGQAGGGKIRIGGDAQGSGDFQRAQLLSIDSATIIRADALDKGNGGTTVAWSDGLTTARGTFNARGGPNGGDGGWIETSGHQLDFIGIKVDASSAHGAAGTWLLDPIDLTVNASAAASIQGALNGGTSVTLQTFSSGAPSGLGIQSSGLGDININSVIAWNSGATLTLSAFNALNINAEINVQNDAGRLVLNTGHDAQFTRLALLNFDYSGWVQFSNNANASATGRLTINGTGYTLLYGCFCIANNDSGNYALAFTPGQIPTGPGIVNFNGTFEGLGNAQFQFGGTNLFASVGTNGIVRDFGLTSEPFTGNGLVNGPAFIGTNQGILANAYLTACGNCGGGFYNVAAGSGALVGTQNGGLITNSYVIGSITGGGNGLVGTLTNNATLRNSFFLGTVAGNAGGLIGSATNSFVTNVYTDSSGGLAASATNTSFTNAYYDKTTFGGTSSFGTGLTTTQLQASLPSGFSSSTWGIIAGTSYPYLLSQAANNAAPVVFSGTAYTDAGATPASGVAVSIMIDGYNFADSLNTERNGYFYFIEPPGTVRSTGSTVFAYVAQVQNINFNPVTVETSVNTALNVTQSVTGMDLWANTFGVSTSATLLSQVSQVDIATAMSAFNTQLHDRRAPTPGCCLINTAGSFTIDQATSLGVATHNGGNLTVNAAYGGPQLNSAGNVFVNASLSGTGISAAGNITVAVPINYTGTATMTAGGSITFDNTFSSGGATVLNAGTSITFGNSFSSPSTVTMTAGTSITFDSSFSSATTTTLTASTGAIAFDGSLSFTALTLNAGTTINFSGALNSTGRITLNAGGNITTEPVNVGTFILAGGTWSQIGSSLPAFSATDFRITGGTFNRFANTSTTNSGSSGNPYQIFDVYGLQAVASSAFLNNGYYFVLTQNIDASTTATWWSGAGFSPIGNGSVSWTGAGATVGATGTAFTGTFNGAGYTVNNLFINRGSQTDVGLFGSNAGTIENLGVINGSITGFGNVGGLAGNNLGGGSITNSYTSMFVTGQYLVGGFVGTNLGTISQSYALSQVTGTKADIGGFVGNNRTASGHSGLIQNSYSQSTVIGTGATQFGGFFGENEGNATISNSYASSIVSGTGGGFGGVADASAILTNNFWDTGTSNQNNAVQSGAANATGVSGLGDASMRVATSFTNAGWDFTSIWSVVNGASLPYLRWQIPGGVADVVTGTAYKDSGVTLLIGGIVSIQVDGATVGSGLTGTNGIYSILIPASAIDPSGSNVLAYELRNTSTGILNSASFAFQVTGPTVAMPAIWGGYLTMADPGANISSINAAIAPAWTAAGAVSAAFASSLAAERLLFSGAFTVDQSPTMGTGPLLIATTTGNNITVTTPLTLAGTATLKLNSGQDIVFQSGATLSGSGPISLTAAHDIGFDAVSLSTGGTITATATNEINFGAISGSGSITATTTGASGVIAFNAAVTGTTNFTLNAGAGQITDTADFSAGQFILNGGTWNQIANPLPAFSATDFRINGGLFERFANTSTTNIGSSANPYQIVDIYGLQALESGTFLSNRNLNFELVNNIDASATATWNSGSGFLPLGAGDQMFTIPAGNTYGNNAGGGPAFQGTFNGQYYTINNITINSNRQDVGVFGSNAGTINNVGVVGGSITGPLYVGGLVGFNFGTINNSFTQTTVSGVVVGGFAGGNGSGGVISQSYANSYVSANAGAVFVNGFVGLAGGSYSALPAINWYGTIKDSYVIPAGGASGFASAFSEIFCACSGMQPSPAVFTNDLVLQGGVAQYAGGLPNGFSSSIWGLIPGYSYPYLLWQFPGGTPQAVSGQAFATTSGIGLSNTQLALFVNGAAAGSTMWTDGSGYYQFLVPQGTIGASSQILVYAPTLTTTNGAASMLQTNGNVANNNLYVGYLGWTTAGTTFSGLAAAETAAFGGNTSIQSYVNALPNLEVTSTNSNPFTINQPLTPTGGVAIYAYGGISVTSAITTGSPLYLSALNGNDVTVAAPISSTSSVSVLAGGNITVSALISSTSSVSVQAGGDITFEVPVSAGSSFSAIGDNISLQAVSWANGPLTINAIGTLTLDGVLTGTGSNAGGTIRAGGPITIPGASWQNGILTIAATGAVNLGAMNGTGSNAGATISGTSITTSALSWANGPLTLTATGAVTFNGVLNGSGANAGATISGTAITDNAAVYWQNGLLTMTATGAIVLNGALSGVGPGAGANITGASVAANGINWQAGNLTLRATNGDVSAGDVIGWGPGASLTIVGHNVTLGNGYWANGGLNLQATAGNVAVFGSLIGTGTGAGASITGQSIQINGGLVWSNGGLNLVASNGDVIVGAAAGGGSGAGGFISGNNIYLGELSWANGTMTTTTSGALSIDRTVDGMGSAWTLSAGTIAVGGAVGVGTFNLNAGNWSQNDPNLAPFYAGAFNLAGGTQFTRFAGGDGSIGTPYVITDIYGLQGLVTTPALYNKTFALGADIQAGTTAGWNGGAGFIPIGTASQQFNGTFLGQNHDINGLTINRPGSDNVGLFGYVNGFSTRIQDFNLTNVSITGNNNVGGLVGSVGGAVRNLTVTGNVTGLGDNVGGVAGSAFVGAGGNASGFFRVGFNGNVFAGTPTWIDLGNGTYHGSATGGTGGSNVGGLVGVTTVSVSQGYASGTVNSQGRYSANIGGLVGWLQSVSTNINENASVTNSVSSAAVTAIGDAFTTHPGFSGAYYVGGLIGQNGNLSAVVQTTGDTVSNNRRMIGGRVTSSYATGSVTGAGVPLGGLIGYNAGVVSNSSASGAVSVQGYGNYPDGFGQVAGVGGLVGFNVGTISQSWATGSVTNPTGTFTGGLVGQHGAPGVTELVLNLGVPSVTDSYASGAVTGSGPTGGLFGILEGLATFTRTYAMGAVSGGSAGGIAGWTNNSTENLWNFWNVDTTGRSNAVGAVLSGNAGAYWRMDDFAARNQGALTGEFRIVPATLPNGSQIFVQVAVHSYEGFDFNSVWMTSPAGYPVLRNQTVLIVPNPTSAAYGTGNPSVGYSAYGQLGYQSANGVNIGFNGTTTQGSGGSLSNGGNVTFVYLLGAVAITPRNITVQGGTIERYYGDTNPFSTGSVGLTAGQLANGDSIGLVNISGGPGAANNTHNGGADADAGYSYGYTTSNAFFTSGSALNYNITYANGSIAVLRRPVSVQLTGSTSKVYDGTTSGAVLNASNFLLANVYPGAPDYNALSANIAGVSAGTFGSANAGTGINVTATGVSLASSNPALALNYTLASTTASGAIGTITPKQLTGTVVISGINKTYDGTTAAGAGLITLTGIDGLLAGASTTISSLTGIYGSANAGAQTVSGLTGLASSNGNYSVGSLVVTGIGTISPRQITVTADALTKVYGNIDPALTFAVGGSFGLAAGDTQASVFTGSQTRVAGESVAGGPYGITQGSLLANSNYSITQYTGSALTITPRQITVSADAQTKVYGNVDPTLSFTVGGSNLGNGDTQATAFTGSQTRVAGETVAGGPYGISQGTLLANSNYSITQYTGSSLTITPRQITVSADTQTKVYGNVDPTLTFAVGGSFGLAAGDTQASVFTGSQTRVAGETVLGGPYAITQGSLLANSNYSITQYSGSALTIAPRQITVAADPKTKVYGEIDPALTFAVGGSFGLAAGDTQASVFTGSQTRVAGETVLGGPYTIAQGSLLANSNYLITQYTGSQLAITPRQITVTADAQTKIYGAPDPTLTFAVGGSFGLAAGDTQASVFTGSQTRAAGETVAGGPYSITQGSLLVSSNYSITQYTGSQLAITPRSIVVSALGGISTYGDKSTLNPGLSATGLQFHDDVSVLTGLSNSFGITNFTNAGSHTLSVIGSLTNTNYNVLSRVDGTWVVNPAPLTVTANDQSKTLGQTFTFAGTEFTPAGLQNGETIALTTLSSPGAPATANLAGSPYTINISKATGGTANLDNYQIIYVTGLLKVKSPPPVFQPLPSPPGSSANNVGINFQPPPTTRVSFTTGTPRTTGTPGTGTNAASNKQNGNDVNPASLTAGDAFMHNSGLYLPPISQYDADQYSDFKLPSYANSDSQATVLTILARGIAQANASKYLIDGFWNGSDNTWPGAGNIDLLDKAGFSDGAGHQATPTNDPAFPIVSGTTDFAALLKNGPVMIGGPADQQPVQWMLATGMAPDGKGIICDDTMTGGLVELGYDPTTRTVGGVIKLFDAKSSLFVPLADASNSIPASDARGLTGLQGFVPATYYAVTIH